VKFTMQKTTIGAAVLAFASLAAFAAPKAQTFTGEVSDSMCGAKHAMAGSNAACTRACIKKGSDYTLVSGDKVYTLKTSDKAVLSELDSLAGQKANVTGTADGDNIEVSKVSAVK
jgi:hypothetical protein